MNGTTLLALVLVVVVPLVILATSEVEERLRQHDSDFVRPVHIIRLWLLPPLAAWLLLVPLLDVDRDNVVVALVASWALLAAVAAVLAVIRILIDRAKRRRDPLGRQSIPQLLLALPRLITFIVAGWLLIAGIWDIDLSAALTALGVTSLVISFALQDTLSGLASGVLLLGDQPFQTGDWISVGDIEGLVVDINWRTSRIRTRDGDVIVVPNSELAGSKILNYTDEQALHRIVFPVQVAFVNAPSLAKDMLLDAARSTPGVLAEPPPQAMVVQVDDPLMGYEVHMWVADYAIVPRVKSDFGSLVWYQSHRHNVPLPSPAQDLYLWDGPTAGIDDSNSPPKLRAALTSSPLLASLPEDELDRLGQAARAERFAVGEVIARSDAPQRDLVLIVEGEAQLAVRTIGSTGDEQLVVAAINDGDVVGLLGSVSVGDHPVVLQALTDCSVLIVDSNVASEVGSRHGDLAEAVGRTTTTWRRRIERLLERQQQRDVLEVAERAIHDASPDRAVRNGAGGDDRAPGLDGRPDDAHHGAGGEDR